MQQAFLALEQPAKAVAAQEMLTEIDPTQQTFQNLALLAYQAGQLRKGDLAAGKAVDLAPKDEQKEAQGTARAGEVPGRAAADPGDRAEPDADHRLAPASALSCAPAPL